MTFPRRILLAAVVAVLVIAAITSLVFVPGGSTKHEGVRVAKDDEAGPATPEPQNALTSSSPAEPTVTQVAAGPEDVPAPPASPEPEPLIEDLLAESGEDPGAVYYMSRVREAIREGNPTFAGELLRQMKEEHSSSVLVEEAEALLASGR